MNVNLRLFGGCLVSAESVEDFAARYRRFDRYTGRSEVEQRAILETHRQELSDCGITWISGKDSVTGQVVSWQTVTPSLFSDGEGS